MENILEFKRKPRKTVSKTNLMITATPLTRNHRGNPKNHSDVKTK